MANLVQGIFQGLPVKAPHSPVALPLHPDEQALGSNSHPLSHPGITKKLSGLEGLTDSNRRIVLFKIYTDQLGLDDSNT